MDSTAVSAGPWLVLGVVLGLLMAGAVALAVVRLRPGQRGAADGEPTPPADARPPSGWIEDDLPGFLDHPPGTTVDPARDEPAPRPGGAVAALASSGTPLLDAPAVRPTPASTGGSRVAVPAGHRDAGTGRMLVALTATAVLLVGLAAAVAGLSSADRSASRAAAPAGSGAPARTPTWDVPDLTPPPARPSPGDPGAGALAVASVPLGPEGVVARLSFGGLVLERRAVGITAAYPSVSLTASDVPGGPALAHVRLPQWNCLTDEPPADPVAAGCRRLPTLHADLPSPALTVHEHGEGLRISGRFPTYVRPNGSAPEWTGQVYPFRVQVAPAGDGARGALHLGTARAESLDDPLLSRLRRGR